MTSQSNFAGDPLMMRILMMPSSVVATAEGLIFLVFLHARLFGLGVLAKNADAIFS